MRKAFLVLAVVLLTGCGRMPEELKCNSSQHVSPDSTGTFHAVVQAGCTDTITVTYNYPK